MPTISMKFWGLLKDGHIVEVYKSEREATTALHSFGRHNGWSIAPVQVIYN